MRDEAYCAAVSATHFDRWFPVLRGLGGDRFDRCHVVRMSSEQIQRFLKPARQAAQNGVSAAQLFHEELTTLAAELIVAQPSLAEAPPAAGWFVRTDSCSPKDAELDELAASCATQQRGELYCRRLPRYPTRSSWAAAGRCRLATTPA